MKSPGVFAVKDYLEYLQERVEAESARGALTRLAEAARCQKSHITRVLKGQLHLTLEQAFRLARYWHFSEEEENYFLKLVERDRSGDPQYRAKLERELRGIRQGQEDIARRLKQETIASTPLEMLYYSAWYWSAIHIIVSIPQFQTPAAISARLGLPEALVLHCLQTLAAHGMVEKARDRWKFSSFSIHLPKNSPLNSIQHGNWRARAVMASQQPNEDGVHYTVTQSLSRADFERVKHLVLETIDQYVKIAEPSREEELICFACDFFRV